VIGLVVHLAARGLDVARAEMAEARSMLGWGLAFVALGRGTPDPSEVEQLGAECDALRDERDKARCLVEAWQGEAEAIGREREGLKHKLWEAEAKIESLQEQVARWDRRHLEADRGNHAAETKLTAERDEARLEHAAAVEVCDELRGLLTKARAERLEALSWRGVAASVEREAVEARAQLEELRALARAAISTSVEGCVICGRVATVADAEGDLLCDGCKDHHAEGDTSNEHHAAAWRALLAALPPEAPRG
jgi:hypothetical protein